MGVSFVIGNAELDYDIESKWVGATVGRIELEDGYLKFAGDDGNFAKRNSIGFSYHSWREYLTMFDMPILGEWYSKNHSGITVLTHEMHDEIKRAIALRKSQLGAGFVPGFVETFEMLPDGKARIFTEKEIEQKIAETKRDGYWAHLELFDFWMSYTFRNCERPAIYNF